MIATIWSIIKMVFVVVGGVVTISVVILGGLAYVAHRRRQKQWAVDPFFSSPP